MSKVVLSMSLETAQAVARALDLFTRLGLGKFDAVAELVAGDLIPVGITDPGGNVPERKSADPEQLERIRLLCQSIKSEMGYPTNGSNGIGHPHVAIEFLRTYEAMKVLDKALAENRDPNPRFRGVHYDGLICRYTQDPAPESRVDAT